MNSPASASVRSGPHDAARARRRRRAERIFQGLGFAALGCAGAVLLVLLGSIVYLGVGAFSHYEARLEVTLDPVALGLIEREGAPLRSGDYRGVIRGAMVGALGLDATPETERAVQALISPGASFSLARRVSADPHALGEQLEIGAILSDDAQLYLKGAIAPESESESAGQGAGARLSAEQCEWLDLMRESGRIERRLSAAFLTGGDSSYPELAGLGAGIVGSFIAVGLAILIAAPLGVVTAVFLEEFAPKNWVSDFIEINVNNLAAVPSIIFGLLGLTVFILFFGLPRSAPLVGGLVLTLMTLPTIIIATRAALRSLPQSLKEGALALGASRLEAVWNPLLPAAAPGIVTGVILGFAQALGETAPLLLIGMVAFVASPAASALDPSSALPVLVYLWAVSPERAFVEKTAGAVMVLLFLLIVLNGAAAYMRARFDPYKGRG